MLKYENIYAICDAEERLRRGYRWGSGHHTKDSDALLMFTIGPKADEDAASNLNFLLSLGQEAQCHSSCSACKQNPIPGQRCQQWYRTGPFACRVDSTISRMAGIQESRVFCTRLWSGLLSQF
jgi:hypothetical protein